MRGALIRFAGRGLRVALLAYVGIGAAVWWFEEDLLFHPPPTPLTTCDLPQGAKLARFDGEQGIFTPAGGKRLAIFFHGNAETACNWRHLGVSHLARLGFDTLAVEYPGYAGDLRATTYDGLKSLTRAAAGFAEAYDEVALIGFSMGTGVAALYAAEAPAAAVLLFAPFDSLYALARSKGYLYPRVLWRTDLDPSRHLAGFAGPVTIVLGEADRVVPPESARRLAEALRAAGADVSVSAVSGAGHTGLFARPAFDETLARALRTE